MTKEKYVQEEFYKITYRRVEFLLLFGAFLFLLLSLLDYLTVPARFYLFLLLRTLISAFLILCYFVLSILRNKRLPLNIFILVTTSLCAVVIELMILNHEGPHSPYYAGLILLSIFSLGMIPLPIIWASFNAIAICAIYIIPALFFFTNKIIFIVNFFFLIIINLTLLIWRYLDNKRLQKEITLTQELAKEKELFSEYSYKLEQLVEERTKELHMSETLLNTLFENANEGIIITNLKGTIIKANPYASKLHGFEVLEGLNIQMLEVPNKSMPWERKIKELMEKHTLLYETEHYTKDGNRIPLEISSSLIEINDQKYIQLFCRDISERKKMQAELIYSQKMESIGIMAGGIAHDFNNILSAILGNVELLRMQESLTESFLQRLNDIEQAARSASQIVSKLLDFARKKPLDMVTIDLNMVVSESMKLISNLKPPNIEISVNLYEKPLMLKADPIMLEQAIVNIILNAFDAMPQGGALRISTTIVEKGGEKKAKLSLSDTGVGIPPEHLPYIFDPFFTTKKKGKGTGLGLAVVYGIVKEHKGNIEVESYISQGTTFHIYLPLLQQQEKNTTSVPMGTHTILVIDDEERIISFIKEVLEKEGINVIGTTNPEEGLELFKTLRRSLKTVIVDLVMPNIDGKTLITSFKKLSPTVKIICITGYPKLSENIPFDFLLVKPFDRLKLLETIKKIISNN